MLNVNFINGKIKSKGVFAKNERGYRLTAQNHSVLQPIAIDYFSTHSYFIIFFICFIYDALKTPK